MRHDMIKRQMLESVVKMFSNVPGVNVSQGSGAGPGTHTLMWMEYGGRISLDVLVDTLMDAGFTLADRRVADRRAWVEVPGRGRRRGAPERRGGDGRRKARSDRRVPAPLPVERF